MKTLRNSIMATSLIVFATRANAGFINFADIANGTTGESAWGTYTVTDIDATMSATAGNTSGQSAFVYLDRDTGGMGVCSSGVNASKANKTTNSGANLCGYPTEASDDDNVTTNEFLVLKFSQNVIINTLWFNNFHDGDHSLLGDQITIGGADYTFTNGSGNPKTWSSTLAPYALAANEEFHIAYKNEEFYLHQIDFYSPGKTVPAPATIALFATGLAGLGWSRRKKA